MGILNEYIMNNDNNYYYKSYSGSDIAILVRDAVMEPIRFL